MADELQKAFGKRIRDLRKAQGFSQEHFADLCGVHRSYMGAVERGEKNVGLESQNKFAKTLKITLAQLMTGLETYSQEPAAASSAQDNISSLPSVAPKARKQKLIAAIAEINGVPVEWLTAAFHAYEMKMLEESKTKFPPMQSEAPSEPLLLKRTRAKRLPEPSPVKRQIKK